MKRVLTMLAVIAVLAPASLWAQDVPKAEVFGGFSILSIGNSGLNGDRYNPLGWAAAVTGNVNETWAFKGDFSGSYKDGGKTHLYLGGVQAGARKEKAHPFVHALLGGHTSSGGGSSDSGFTMGFGGGVDFKATEKVDIRVVQFDWLPSKGGGEWEKNIIRFGFGIVFKSGTK
jgi:hypothetical protein